MNKEQIDILIKDGDIIPESQKPVYVRDIKKDLPPILNTPIVPIRGERFRISIDLDELLNYVYDESLKIAVKLKHEKFQRDIEALTQNKLPKKYTQQYFENKIQEQMRAKEALIVQYSIGGNGMSRMCFKLEEIIECIKFKIFKGGKIENLENEKKIAAFTVLYKYFFFVDELKEVIKAISIEESIKYLQEKISELDKKEPSHRISAIIHKYKEDAGYAKPLNREMMRDIGGKNREKAFDSIGYFNGAKPGKTFRAITITEIEKAIKSLDDCPNAKKTAEIDLENIINS